MAWYQSDIKIGQQADDGHVQIKTILLDDIFGFDPDVRLAPTNTFHLGFWFDNPQDAAALPSCHFDPTQPTPFNSEHKAGPFAMLSVPDAKSGLGHSARIQTIPQPQQPATQTETTNMLGEQGRCRVAPGLPNTSEKKKLTQNYWQAIDPEVARNCFEPRY